MKKKLADLRIDYGETPLLEENLPEKPMDLLRVWLDNALEAGLYEPNAMILSTIDKDLQPDSRVVLLKGIVEEKLVFYSNYSSSKGIQIEMNEKVSAVFFWKELHRQVRIQGKVEKSPSTESDDYFHSRPRDSQLGARASQQSAELPDRKSLEKAFLKEKDDYKDKDVPRPKNWGGYRIIPTKFEFWQGRSSRLHDRLEYQLENVKWKTRRLSP